MFSKLSSIEDCKNLFRKLSLRLHPDAGGSNELFILLQKTYEARLNSLPKVKKSEPKKKKEQVQAYERTFQGVIVLGDDRLKIINEIADYAASHDYFKTDFVESVIEFLDEHGFITGQQFNSLVKVYYSFRMNEK